MSFICDPSANFLPGMVAQLTIIGNQVMCGVSDGTAPIGIIDDINTRNFVTVAWNEVKVAPVPNPVMSNGQLVTPTDVVVNLTHPFVVKYSFVSTVDVALNEVNGTITFPAGTPLNYDLIGTGTPNALQTVCNYAYSIPNIVGDSSVQGSGRITVWIHRMVFSTDQFETNQVYPVNANCYVSPAGLITTRKYSPNSVCIGLVLAPPLSLYNASSLQVLFL